LITLRRAGIADAARVADFAARVYRETFEADNTPEDMAAYLASAFGADRQRAEMSSDDIVTLVAEHEGAMVAYAMVRRDGPAPACVTMPRPVELWRFYVDREWHGRGVAPALMDGALDAARELGGRSMWLGVWERNARALGFYAKYGFIDVGSHDFIMGSDRQTDRVLAREVEG
jgi:diamine N-acetyltransferase